MVARVGEAYYELTARDQKLLSSLSNVENRMVRGGRTAQGSFGGATQGAFDKTSGTVDRLGGSLVKAEAATGRFGGIFKNVSAGVVQGVGIGAFMGVTTAVGAMVGGVKRAVDSASNLAETQSKVTVVFGESSNEILKWGQNSATAFGQSQNQALGAAATFGNLFVALKLPNEEIPKMSKGLVELASDLASFNNIDPTEALDALRAGLVGETEPLRRLGVNMNEATLQAKALELGLVDSVKNGLTPAVKAQAAYALIMEQTTTAQGDFARTASGLANQQRTAAARIEDAFARMGKAIVPLISTILPPLTDLFVGVVEGVGELAETIGELMATIKPVTDVLSGFGEVLGPGGVTVAAGLALATLLNLKAVMNGVDTASVAASKGGMLSATLVLIGLAQAADDVYKPIADAGAAIHDFLFGIDKAFGIESPIQPSEWQWPLGPKGAPDWARFGQEAADGAGGIAGGIDAALAKSMSDLSNFPGKVKDDLVKGWPTVGEGADKLAAPIPEALDDAQEAASRIARRTPHEIAKALNDATFHVEDAMDDIEQVIENSMSEQAEIASIKSFLTGSAMEKGLNDKRASVRAVWQAYKADAEERLYALQHNVDDIAADTGVDYTEALAAAKGAVGKAAGSLTSAARDRFERLEGQAGGYGDRTGDAYIGKLSTSLQSTYKVKMAIASIAEILRAGSPPGPESPLHLIDVWAERTAQAYADGFFRANGYMKGKAREFTANVGEALIGSPTQDPATGLRVAESRTSVDPGTFAHASDRAREVSPVFRDVSVHVAIDKLNASDPLEVASLGRRLGEEVRLSIVRTPTTFARPGTG